MKRIRSAIQIACLVAFCAGLPPALSGCGGSDSGSTDMSKIDQTQAKSAEEATAKAHKNMPKPQAKRY
jgi:hypothetical protein